MNQILTKLARWYLKRQGAYVVEHGTCQMILSGHFLALRQSDGSYRVFPPHPHTYIVALNHTVITDNTTHSYQVHGDETTRITPVPP